jgi:formamidopyrimidine-DNA glycosylase
VGEQDAVAVDDDPVCSDSDIHRTNLLPLSEDPGRLGVMPELPEVTALAADLDGRLKGRVIERLSVLAFAALKTFDPPVEALKGLTIAAVSRHGKFLDITAGDLHVVVHLARAGWIRWRDGPPPPPSGRPGSGPLAARLVLDDGSGLNITEAGTKKSLAIYVVHDPSDVPGIARLGPDPLDPSFTVDVLAGILAAQGRAQIKGVLRNQSVIAGIGNAYSDEILHVAKMSPYKPASMPADDVARLYEAMQSTLRDALARADGLAASELKSEKKSNLRVHGRTGQPCPVCGDTIRQVIFHDSTFQYCPTCQTGGKPLADRVLSRLLK